MNKVSIGEYNTLVNKYNEVYKENKQLKSILKSKPDTEITLQDDKGNKFILIQSERIDMQEKLNKTIERLLNNWNKLKEDLRKIRDLTFTKYNKNEWENCLSFNDDILPLIEKMQELEGSDRNE